MRYSEDSERSCNALEKRSGVMDRDSADMTQIGLEGRELDLERQDLESEPESEPAPRRLEMEMQVDIIFKENGGVLSWLADERERENRGEGRRRGVSRAVDRAGEWIRRARSRRSLV